MAFNPTRRELLLGAASATLATAVPALAPARLAPRKRNLRIAHLTDIHVTSRLNAEKGMLDCLRHVNSLRDRPDLILTGGDLVMDTLEATRNSSRQQWELFTKNFRDGNQIPVHHCLGNHDIWGWYLKAAEADPADRYYGKSWALDLLEMASPYYSFDAHGWHFVVLDSVHQREGFGYIGTIEDKQFAWLEADLKAVPAGVSTLVVSHIPILSVTPFMASNDKEKGKQYDVSISTMISNARKVVNLFAKYPTVKLALSGHVHLNDRVEYNGVTYICDGAVSGSWWGGDRYETKPGYGVVDLFNDGSFESSYIPWGWKPAAESPKAEIGSWEEAMAYVGAR